MELSQTKESLLQENCTLLNNFNTLKNLVRVFQGEMEYSQLPQRQKLLFQKRFLKYNETPLIDDTAKFLPDLEFIEYLKSKNSTLHHLIENLFNDLLAIEVSLYYSDEGITSRIMEENEKLEEENLNAQDASGEEENGAMISKIQVIQERLDKLQQAVEDNENLKNLSEGSMISSMQDLQLSLHKLQQGVEEEEEESVTSLDEQSAMISSMQDFRESLNKFQQGVEKKEKIKSFQESCAMVSKIQDLQQSLTKHQHGVEEEESLKSLKNNTLKELGEEKDSLKGKVKELEEKLEERSTYSEKTASYLEEKEKWDVEKMELETIMNVITTYIRDAKYSATDHEEELMRTINLQGIYTNVIKAFLQDVERLYEKILKNTDKIRKPSLCKRISWWFCHKWKRNEKRMRFLLKEKFKATNEAEVLKTKSRRAQHILNIFRAIVDDQRKELGILHKRMKTLDEKLLEYRPSFFKRLLNFFCGRWTGYVDNIFHRQKRQSATMAETLEKKLEDMQKFQYVYEILTEKIEDKIVRLNAKAQIISEELLRLNNHPVMAKELVKILSQK